MNVNVPHYLLFSEGVAARPGRFVVAHDAPFQLAAGRWRFVLEALDGSQKIEAADVEPQVAGERLELLAVVRGLEALPQPSHVTLLTTSRYVNRGIRFGLDEWRENGWQWECFGKMRPVKNSDLWQRVDQALQIHVVRCRVWTETAGAGEDEETAPLVGSGASSEGVAERVRREPAQVRPAERNGSPRQLRPRDAAPSGTQEGRNRPRGTARGAGRRRRPTRSDEGLWHRLMRRVWEAAVATSAPLRVGA